MGTFTYMLRIRTRMFTMQLPYSRILLTKRSVKTLVSSLFVPNFTFCSREGRLMEGDVSNLFSKFRKLVSPPLLGLSVSVLNYSIIMEIVWNAC